MRPSSNRDLTWPPVRFYKAETQQDSVIRRNFIRLKTIKGHRKMRVCPDTASRRRPSVLVLLLLLSLCAPTSLLTRSASAQSQAKPATTSPDEIFRLERVPVDGGAELITIHARLDGIETPEVSKWVPLVSVLRDTLGDFSPENDRLRYVWPLTYTRPTVRQRVSGAIPFLYSRVGNKDHSSEKAPPWSAPGRSRSRRLEQNILDSAPKSPARSLLHACKGFYSLLSTQRCCLP